MFLQNDSMFLVVGMSVAFMLFPFTPLYTALGFLRNLLFILLRLMRRLLYFSFVDLGFKFWWSIRSLNCRVLSLKSP